MRNWMGCEDWKFDGGKGRWEPVDQSGRRVIQTYKDLDVYNLAYNLAMEIFQLSGKFPKEERYSLVDQMRRSSRSVCANVVEGYAKRRYENVFKSSLNAALGESEETKLWLDFAMDCEYLLPEKHAVMFRGYEQVGAMTWTLMTRWESFK
jgi:four helix bundle protein